MRRFGFPIPEHERPPLTFSIATCTEEHLPNDGGAEEVAERRWTLKSDGFLRRMHVRGKSMTWIARALGRTRAACAARAVALGVAQPRRVAATGVPAPAPAPSGPEGDVVGEGLCRWIHGSLPQRWRMCGHPSVHGTAWCAHHLARVRPAPKAQAGASTSRAACDG